MAKLTGQTIADSYDQLLIVSAADGISASLQVIESADTDGGSSALKIATKILGDRAIKLVTENPRNILEGKLIETHIDSPIEKNDRFFDKLRRRIFS